jgi:hypothetical protein
MVSRPRQSVQCVPSACATNGQGHARRPSDRGRRLVAPRHLLTLRSPALGSERMRESRRSPDVVGTNLTGFDERMSHAIGPGLNVRPAQKNPRLRVAGRRLGVAHFEVSGRCGPHGRSESASAYLRGIRTRLSANGPQKITMPSDSLKRCAHGAPRSRARSWGRTRPSRDC